MTFYITYIASCLIAVFMGVIEAVMFCGSVKKEHISEFWKRKSKVDIHFLLTAFRGLIYGIISFILFKALGIIGASIYLISVVLSFSFWHNSAYYYARSKLDVAYNGIFDSSKDTSAKISMNFESRFVLFILAIALLIGYFFYIKQ